MSGVNISTLIIRDKSNAQSFERGEEYFRTGMVSSLTQRWKQIQAEVKGSEEQPYRVTITFNKDELSASCNCPYNYNGWCKHIVAAALTCSRQANSIVERPSLSQLLDKLDHAQTQRLVQELVEEHPELINKIDSYVNTVAKSSSFEAPAQASTVQQSQKTGHKIVNKAQIKASVRQIFREAVYGWENGNDSEEDTVHEELLSLIQTAVEYCEKGEADNALASLEAITDACASDWDDVADYGVDNSEIVQALNEAWCEAILTAELTKEERTDIQINLETWQDNWNADFSLANAALIQGWDYPPLIQILSGNITRGIWSDGEIPDYADTLALIRLKILERNSRYQEYLYLAEAEKQTKQYLTMLGRLGRVDDAVRGAQNKMSTMEEAFELAKTLQQQRALQEALDVAQQGFNLPGNCRYDLGIWASELARDLGNESLAILALKNAFYARPSFTEYRMIQDLAGENWA